MSEFCMVPPRSAQPKGSDGEGRQNLGRRAWYQEIKSRNREVVPAGRRARTSATCKARDVDIGNGSMLTPITGFYR
jgi:hypothetical protein